jgi:hypothetical protein
VARRLTEILGRHEYETSLGEVHEPQADASILVGGGNDPSRFLPNVNASKWNDAAWLNFNFKDIVVSSEQEVWTDADGRMEITVGGLTWRSYVHPETATDQNDSILEVELVTPVRLRQNIEIQLDYPDGLTFHLQRPLTQAEIDDGAFTYPNCKGSYAVYWKDNFWQGSEYMTGKFGHLYRWQFTDAIGQTWSDDLSFDPVTKILTIPVPPANWWNQAVYPVTCMGMGDTLGYSTACANNAFLKNGRIDYWELNGTAGSSGTLDDIYFYNDAAGASTNLHFGVYDDSSTAPTNLINDTTGSYTGDQGWMSATGIGSGSISSGGVYWAVAFPEQNNDAKAQHDTGQSDDKDYEVQVYGALPDPASSTNANTDYRTRAYINFSAGAAQSVGSPMHMDGTVSRKLSAKRGVSGAI